MLKKTFKLLILYLFTSLLMSSNGFAFHKKNAIERDVYENLEKDEVAFKYCANKVKPKTTKDDTDQVVGNEDKLGWIVFGSHDSQKILTGEKIFFEVPLENNNVALHEKKLNYKINFETRLDEVLKMLCLQYDDEIEIRPIEYKNSSMVGLFNIIAQKNGLIKNEKPNAKLQIGEDIYRKGLIIDEPNIVYYIPDFLISIHNEIEEAKVNFTKDQDAKEIARAKERKWVEENKPIILEKAEDKKEKFDATIKNIKVNLSSLKTDYDSLQSEYNNVLNGIDETKSLLVNKDDDIIREKFKKLLKDEKNVFQDKKLINYEKRIEDLRAEVNKLKKEVSYKKIKNLVKDIDSTSRQKKLKKYDKEVNNIGALPTASLSKKISKLKTEISDFKTQIYSTKELKEQIDARDRELGEKTLIDRILEILIYVGVVFVIIGIVAYIYFQNKKISSLSRDTKSADKKFSELEGQITETAKQARFFGLRGRKQEDTLVSPTKPEKPKTPQQIIIEKYEEMISDYKEALDNFSKVASFKQKWNGLALTRKERQDGTKTVLINSPRAFEKSEIWCVNFSDKYFALPGSSVKSNMAAYMNLDFEKAQRDFKGVFSILSGSSYLTEACLLRRGGSGFVVEKIGKLQFPQ